MHRPLQRTTQNISAATAATIQRSVDRAMQSQARRNRTTAAAQRIGLPNPTGCNRCYLNATVQCLAYAPLLAEALMRRTDHVDATSVAGKLGSLITTLRSGRPRGAAGADAGRKLRELQEALRNAQSRPHNFYHGAHEDCVETMQFILQEACAPGKEEGATAATVKTAAARKVRKTLEGCLRGVREQHIHCMSEGCMSGTTKADIVAMHLDILQVPLPQTGNTQAVNLKDMRPIGETISRTCGYCDGGKACKTSFSLDPPPIILLHIQRNTSITGPVNRRGVSLPLKGYQPTELSSASYRLCSFISHMGETADAGHFTAVVHDAALEQWLRYDDNTPVAIVEEITTSTATHTSPNVCLALYAREPPERPSGRARVQRRRSAAAATSSADTAATGSAGAAAAAPSQPAAASVVSSSSSSSSSGQYASGAERANRLQKEDDDEGDNMLGGATAEQMEVESDPAAAAAARQQHRAWQPTENEGKLMKLYKEITVELARCLLMVSHGSLHDAESLYLERGNRLVKYRAIAHAGRYMTMLKENFHLATAVYNAAEAANDGATFDNKQVAYDAMCTHVKDLMHTGELATMRAALEQEDDFDDDDDDFDDDGWVNDDSSGQEDNVQPGFTREAVRLTPLELKPKPESKAARRKRGRDEVEVETATGVPAPQPAARRIRLTATRSAKTRSSASPAPSADPLQAAAAAAVPVTRKRKRVAVAEKGMEAETDEGTTEMREAEPRKKTKGRKKKKKKGANYRRRRKTRRTNAE